MPQRPSPGSGSKTERRSAWPPSRTGAADRGLADVDAEGGAAARGECRDQPAGPAADVEHGALAPVQHRRGRRRRRRAHQRSTSSGSSQPSARRRKSGPRPARSAAAYGSDASQADGRRGRRCSSTAPWRSGAPARAANCGRAGRAAATARASAAVSTSRSARQVPHPQPRASQPLPLHAPVSGVGHRHAPQQGRARARARPRPRSRRPRPGRTRRRSPRSPTVEQVTG